jgi:DNA adenine methylase
MAYLGGKSKSAEHILDVLNHPAFDAFEYFEPFAGYCHIARRIVRKQSYTLSDNNELLIVLLKHIQKYKNNHPSITKKEYTVLRDNPSKDKLRASYAAFCYSYNGKFFGGFVEKYGTRNYPKERKRYYDILHDNPTFSKANILYKDYTHYINLKNKLIYCDPPYMGTTEYHSSFDSELFWRNIRSMSNHNYVFVSEYTAPDDFVCIASKVKRTSMAGRGATRKRIEKLFCHKSKLVDPVLKKIMSGINYPCSKARKFTQKNSNT